MRRVDKISPEMRFLVKSFASSDKSILLEYLWLMKNRTRAAVVATRTADADSVSLLAKLIGSRDTITMKTAGAKRNADDILFTLDLRSVVGIEALDNGEI